MIEARGFVATTTLLANRLGTTDPEQLAFAVENKKAIVTHNRIHFEALARQYFDEGRTIME